MKNLTLAIEEDVLHQARKYALEHKTTVNHLVRQYLAGLDPQRVDRLLALERLKRSLTEGNVKVGPITWKREDLYER